MRKDIKKLLGLQSIWVDSWDIKHKEVIVYVRSPRTSAICPICTKTTKKVHQYSYRLLKHSVWQNKTVYLHLTKRRFYCRSCRKAFSEHIKGIDRRRTTQNYRNLLLKDLSRNSLSYVNTINSSSSSVLYGALKEHMERSMDINWHNQGKDIVLGIDEHSFRGRAMVLTITNITKKQLVKVCSDDRVGTLERFLKTTDKKRITEVCIDMNRGFLNAVRRQLPHAMVTVDKFHVIAYANKILDEIRCVVIGKEHYVRRILFKAKERLNNEQKAKLNFIFTKYRNFPCLYEAYFIKEKLRDFYRVSMNRGDAERRLNQIILFCYDSHSTYLKDLGNTLKRWNKYILNYFVRRSTNAFTEGIHTKIKMIKRVSFGFRNINNYIAKISLAFMPLLYLNHHTF